ncbi:MAG: hypothetical protein QXS20_09130 [Candidatus Thorarchaeota archaeon]
MSLGKIAAVGVALYLISYFVALGLLTLEVFRLYGLMDHIFIRTLLDNLAAENVYLYVVVLAIPPLVFLWFFSVAFRSAKGAAKRQLMFCLIPLAVFLWVAFYGILAILYMAATFIGVYMTAVGSGIGGYEDGKKQISIGSLIALIGVMVGFALELANKGYLDLILPLVQGTLSMPIDLQSSSPSPSGYGIGYYISMISMMYTAIKSARESWQLRADILSSSATETSGGALGMVMNPLFVAFWILATVFFFPLLPFEYLNWGLVILYVVGWVTGRGAGSSAS